MPYDSRYPPPKMMDVGSLVTEWVKCQGILDGYAKHGLVPPRDLVVRRDEIAVELKERKKWEGKS